MNFIFVSAGDEFQTPEKGFDFSKYMKGESGGSSVRRKLVLKRRVSEEKDLPVFQLNPKVSVRSIMDTLCNLF